ncbi:putative E3 ubiquitin-protein ligase UBR7 isoform X1 [Dermochelys coriacea]|uniref:putative E3 ubiquitin-protein ligase UBR7 isoform X1 n=1 Tax=Dermochelys coriacea TaxID=27794 RepID=UPI001CAA3390|nr:putative E3 ubiquitin-protein ligase UBR7 isoform X1 [Dermochelys coriacea]
MEAAAGGAEPAGGCAGAPEEPVVSLADVLAENEELEKEARAVLGGSDHERCSYSQGAVKRQALYACSTCTPPGEEPAGICLACSYECHGTHKLFELYTKRNFRCDCGNSKFKNLQCKLFPEKGKVNSGNKYNHNFYGLYCVCKRPYPDPEDEIPDEMIQCIVCEDWFHGRHLGAVPPESGDFHEMVCQACMNCCAFLWAYTSQLAVPTVTKVTSLEDERIVLNVKETEEQNREIKKESGGDHQGEIKEEEQVEQYNEPSTSSGSKCPETVTKSDEPVCKLRELQTKQSLKKDAATFWPSNWRSKLCTCKDCLKMYSELDVQFLIDECDTVLAYENKGTSDQETDRRDPLMDTLNSMNRVQQVELICVATIPATVNVKRSFSCLKHIKTYLSTMDQGCLSALARISMKKELLSFLEKQLSWYDDVIARFASKEKLIDLHYMNKNTTT